jgi:hypothetical protein
VGPSLWKPRSQSPSHRGALSNDVQRGVRRTGKCCLNPLRIGALSPTSKFASTTADMRRFRLNPLRIGALSPTHQPGRWQRRALESQSPSHRGALSNAGQCARSNRRLILYVSIPFASGRSLQLVVGVDDSKQVQYYPSSGHVIGPSTSQRSACARLLASFCVFDRSNEKVSTNTAKMRHRRWARAMPRH